MGFGEDYLGPSLGTTIIKEESHWCLKAAHENKRSVRTYMCSFLPKDTYDQICNKHEKNIMLSRMEK
jgi:hypothetical protein